MSSKEDVNPTEEDSGSSLLLNQPVVIDNGTSTLKAGFAGSSKPKVRQQNQRFQFSGMNIVLYSLHFHSLLRTFYLSRYESLTLSLALSH